MTHPTHMKNIHKKVKGTIHTQTTVLIYTISKTLVAFLTRPTVMRADSIPWNRFGNNNLKIIINWLGSEIIT